MVTAGAVTIVIYSIYLIRDWLIRSETLSHAATRIVQALEQQDTNTLWHYSVQAESEAYGFDKQDFDRVLREYVYPHMLELTHGDSIPMVAAGGAQFNLGQKYGYLGREIYFDFVTFRTRRGPKAYILSPAILLAMQKTHGEKYAQRPSRERIFGLMREGIKADRKTLEGLGLKGLVELPVGSRLRSWDEQLRICDFVLENPKARSSP